MTEQEKIREGINMKAPIPQALNRVFLDLLSDYDKYKSVNGLSQDYVSLDEYLAKAIANSLYELTKLNVVVKVEGNLTILAPDGKRIARLIKQAGFTATMPLIKEVS